MSNYIQEYGLINESIVDKIITFIKSDKQKMQCSELYSSKQNKKFIDIKKRSSVFKTIHNDTLFDMFDEYVDGINKIDQYSNFTLVRNDIQYIKYVKGGFFKEHEDYLSFVSNIVEEYTMIICEDSDSDGGYTVFEINPFFKHVSKQSTTPKHCLVFRKDIKHSSTMITRGYKNIITANLLRCAKKCDQIIAFFFPNKKEIYTISVNKIKEFGETFLSSMMYFDNTENKKIIQYTEKFVPYESFETIYKIFNRCYITFDEYKKNKQYIDYYCINISNVMIDFGDIIINEKINGNIQDAPDVLICDNSDKAKYLCQIVKNLQMPYMPFKMVCAEGGLCYGGGMEGTPPIIMDMLPVWFSLSENNNLMLSSNLVSFHPYESMTMNDFEKCYSITQNICFDTNTISKYSYIDIRCEDDDSDSDLDSNNNSDSSDSGDSGDSDLDSDDKNMPNDLKIKTSNKLRVDLEYGKHNIFYDAIIYYKKCTISDIVRCLLSTNGGYYVGRRKLSTCIKIQKTVSGIAYDKKNRIVVDMNNYKKLKARLNKIKILKKIPQMVKNMKTVLPQQKKSLEHDFCNETVYGSLNLVMIDGFIKI